MTEKLRVVVADDERPARSVLLAMLRKFEDVQVVGEARDGSEAVEIIERTRPDLALLDLQMPEVDGIGVVRLLKRVSMPMIAFVTAYDEYAVRAFELNAVDYLLKPVDAGRLRETISRAIDRLEHDDLRATSAKNVRSAAEAYESSVPTLLRRIPVRKKNEIVLLPVDEVTSVVADGELLHIATFGGEKHTIAYRLKDLEARLDADAFIRLSRGTLVNIAAIAKVTPMPGGRYRLTLVSGEHLQTSRFHSRLLRERLLRL
ncbi:MAG TPA: response regulator [Thermoanaerobaculia bacterium]|nr:response regulator [Thermoanaerobaculia bacterium]